MSRMSRVVLRPKTGLCKDTGKKENIKISVIVPVYNVEKYLSKCLDSIIFQSYRNLEIICVNDGSTDHSLSVLEIYAAKDSRIIVINQENAGPSKARNSALEIATGDYISFVDSDDFLSHDTYRILVLCAEDRNADIIVFGGNTYPWNAAPSEWLAQKLSPSWKVYQNASPGIVLQENSATPFLWLHFIKRSLINAEPVLRFEESLRLGEDQLFQLLYFPRANKVIFIEDKLYNYRISREDSLMSIYQYTPLKKMTIHINIVKNAIELWKKYDYSKKFADVLVNWIFKFLSANFYEHPYFRQRTLAKEIFDLLDNYDMPYYLLSEEYEAHYQYMKKILSTTNSPEDDLEALIRKLAETEEETEKTVGSKSFRLGRLLTAKSKRIALE